MYGRASRFTGPILVTAAVTILSCSAGQAFGVTHLKRGMEAPAIVLKDIAGKEVNTSDLRGQTVVVLFGEAFHEKTRLAGAQVLEATQDRRLGEQSIVTVLVVTRPVKREDLEAQFGQGLPEVVLHDPDRRAFGIYRVAVMPTVVVIDPQGRVVHAVAGLTARLGDMVTDSLLFGAGRLSEEQYEQALNPAPAVSGGDELRVERTALLARQLARRGLDELAAEKYAEVLELDPQHLQARIELGMLLLKHRRLPDAENQFQGVLAIDPSSMQASLGLAFVQVLRGGDELEEAQRRVAEVLARSPLEPRAHYVQGLIHEQRSRPEPAAASFKRSAQLLLERGQMEQEP
jgi:peroxiredoxin